MARAEWAGQTQVLHLVFYVGVRDLVLGPFSDAFLSTLAGSWIRNRVAGT